MKPDRLALFQSYAATFAISSSTDGIGAYIVMFLCLGIACFCACCLIAEHTAGSVDLFGDNHKGVVGYRTDAKRKGFVSKFRKSQGQPATDDASPVPTAPLTPTVKQPLQPLEAPKTLPASQPFRTPPLCRDLVLSNCGAWFAMDMHMLENRASSFELFAQSGAPLLRASIRSNEVTVSMKAAKSPPLAAIVLSRDPRNFKMDIYARDGTRYGALHAHGPQMFIVTAADVHRHMFDDHEVMRFYFDPQTGQLKASSLQDGSNLACAARCGHTKVFHDEHLEVSVNPGVDAVLVLLCVIGIVVFGAQTGHVFPEASGPYSSTRPDLTTTLECHDPI